MTSFVSSICQPTADPVEALPNCRGLRTAAHQCPLCLRPGRRVLRSGSYWIRECPGCQFRFVEMLADERHTGDVYSDEYFDGGGAGYRNYLADGEMISGYGRYYGNLLRRFGKPGQILDVGCAAGFVARGLAETGWNPNGVEPNRAMAEYARNTFGFNVHHGALETCPTDPKCDAISMIQVIAHLRDLPSSLEIVRQRLRLGGLLLIETWNWKSLMARSQGRFWHEYSPPSVLSWLTPRTLRGYLEPRGFEVLQVGRPSKYIFGEHALSLLSYRLGSSLPALAACGILKTVVPARVRFPYPAFDLFWMVLRKRQNS